MPVITINGPIGAGNIEVGQLIAERLKLDYVDRMVFAEAAKLAGAPVGAMTVSYTHLTLPTIYSV